MATSATRRALAHSRHSAAGICIVLCFLSQWSFVHRSGVGGMFLTVRWKKEAKCGYSWFHVFQNDLSLSICVSNRSYIIIYHMFFRACYIMLYLHVCVSARACAQYWRMGCSNFSGDVWCDVVHVCISTSPQKASSSKAPQRLLLLWKLGELAIAQLWTLSRKLTKLRAHRPIHTSPRSNKYRKIYQD